MRHHIPVAEQFDVGLAVIISINPDWRLRSDGVNWILDHRVQSRKGTGKPKTTWKVAGFSHYLNSIILELARQEIRLIRDDKVYPAETLGLIVETLDRIEADCHRAVREAMDRSRTSADVPEVKMT